MTTYSTLISLRAFLKSAYDKQYVSIPSHFIRLLNPDKRQDQYGLHDQTDMWQQCKSKLDLEIDHAACTCASMVKERKISKTDTSTYSLEHTR